MGLLLSKKRSTERYFQVLHPLTFCPKAKPRFEKPAPWLTKIFKWLNEFIPRQSKRALWLSKPTTWSRKLHSWLRKITPKQLIRTQWLSRVFSIHRKIFSFNKSTTFDQIKKALDNSHFKHLSEQDEYPEI